MILTPKFDQTFAGTRYISLLIVLFGIMFTNITNVYLDNLHSCFGNKTLYAETETMFGRNFTIKRPFSRYGTKCNKNVPWTLQLEPCPPSLNF